MPSFGKAAASAVCAGCAGVAAAVWSTLHEQAGLAERELYRGQYDARQGVPLAMRPFELAGYTYLPLSSLDTVAYRNEIPWEPTCGNFGILVTHEEETRQALERIRTLAGQAGSDSEEKGREAHVVFEAGKSLFGGLAPVDGYSNIEVRSIHSTQTYRKPGKALL
eukprot:TRINITY_DN29365_c0_g1_i1.p1 TRINITY_DN29365_c0_g1~~TRINITY_DN29365_c0_g1_i1.p1  ORF type:complete len:165 (+),score=19.11 TRINITY_DN29365_c0_g1_i1:61-555(+)